jgi:CheY-like chemotaxis protein
MGDGKAILVIDDDPEICDAMQTILEGYGYRVFTALDTVRGRNLLEHEKPSLVILDIMMASMDEGLSFADHIKRKEGVWGIPILIVSARPPAEKGYGRSLEEDMDWISADIFMEKPVEPEDLIHNVQVLLGEAESATE